MTEDRTPPAADHHASAEELSAFVDGELGGRPRARLLDHLTACSLCTERLAAVGRTRRLLRDLETTPPAGAREAAVAAAVQAVRDDAAGHGEPGSVVVLPTSGRTRVRWQRMAGIAAAVIVAAGAASGVGIALSSSTSSRPSASSGRPTGPQKALTTTTMPARRPGGPGQAPTLHLRPGSPVVGTLGPNDVGALRLVRSGGDRDALFVTLRPGRESIVDAVGTGAVVEVGTVVLGTAHAVGPLRIEVTGLSRSAAAQLEADLRS